MQDSQKSEIIQGKDKYPRVIALSAAVVKLRL